MPHASPDAFLIQTYTCKNGHRERIWNSRDGVTPFVVTCRCGAEARHVSMRDDVYALEHVPAAGERIFADPTDDDRRALAERRFQELKGTRYERAESEHEAFIEVLMRDLRRNPAPKLVTVGEVKADA